MFVFGGRGDVAQLSGLQCNAAIADDFFWLSLVLFGKYVNCSNSAYAFLLTPLSYCSL